MLQMQKQTPTGSMPRDWWRGLLGRPQAGTHHEFVFDFSVAPWRLAEMGWPNVSGRLFPENHRWLWAVGGEDRIWTPSLYLGVIPLLLGMSVFTLIPGKDIKTTWCCFLSWTFLASCLASFGIFGLGWVAWKLFRSGDATFPENWLIGPGFGGLYWLITVLLPGYIAFRYPAKWLVFTALAVSQLAAVGYDRACRTRGAAPDRLMGGFVGLSALLLVGVIWQQDRWVSLWSVCPPDAAFGPLKAAGALADLWTGLLQSIVVALIGWGAIRLIGNFRDAVILSVIALDLVVANRWMIVTIPRENARHTPQMAEWIEVLQRRGPSPSKIAEKNSSEPSLPLAADIFPQRIYRYPTDYASHWQLLRSPDRLEELFQWQRNTLWPKYHLEVPLASVEVEGSLKCSDYQFLIWVCRAKSRAQAQNEAERRLWSESLGTNLSFGRNRQTVLPPVGVRYAILPTDCSIEGWSRALPQGIDAAYFGMVLWHSPTEAPRAWIAQSVRWIPPLNSEAPLLVWQRTAEVFFSDGKARDLQQLSFVEAPEDTWPRAQGPWAEQTSLGPFNTGFEKLELPPDDSQGRPLGPRGHDSPPSAHAAGSVPHCRILTYQPGRILLEAKLSRPGLLVLAEQFYPGWKAAVRSEGSTAEQLQPVEYSIPVYRTNRVMCGVFLPAGNHTILFEYRPTVFRWGAWITATTFSLMLLVQLVLGVTKHLRGGKAARRLRSY